MRMKRSVDCNGNSSACCRESFHVNFTTIGKELEDLKVSHLHLFCLLIGWDNWILQPIGYYANYCKGIKMKITND